MDVMEQEALAVVNKIKDILAPHIEEKEEGWEPWCEGFISALVDWEIINEGEFEKLLSTFK